MFQPKPPWRSLPIGTSGEIDIRLEDLPKASTATQEWLRWNITHTGTNVMQPERVSGSLETRLVDGKIWQPEKRRPS